MFAYSLNLFVQSDFLTLGSARIISLFQTSLTLCRTSTSIYYTHHRTSVAHVAMSKLALSTYTNLHARLAERGNVRKSRSQTEETYFTTHDFTQTRIKFPF